MRGLALRIALAMILGSVLAAVGIWTAPGPGTGKGPITTANLYFSESVTRVSPR